MQLTRANANSKRAHEPIRGYHSFWQSGKISTAFYKISAVFVYFLECMIIITNGGEKVCLLMNYCIFISVMSGHSDHSVELDKKQIMNYCVPMTVPRYSANWIERGPLIGLHSRVYNILKALNPRSADSMRRVAHKASESTRML